MKAQFNREYTQEEINKALRQMRPLNSPKLDGFDACFYQKHWRTVVINVYKVVLAIIQGEGKLFTINSTFIALILKREKSKFVNDYRLISLCNVIYKFISKVNYNRLKKVKRLVISIMQSAFIFGRSITNKIIVAKELLHSMKLNKKKRDDLIFVKLDMSKAYDMI